MNVEVKLWMVYYSVISVMSFVHLCIMFFPTINKLIDNRPAEMTKVGCPPCEQNYCEEN